MRPFNAQEPLAFGRQTWVLPTLKRNSVPTLVRVRAYAPITPAF